MLLDANLLLYSVHRESPHYEATRRWLTEQLEGPRPLGLPWQSLVTFLRIATHPRILDRPLDSTTAAATVQTWLSFDAVWTPAPGAAYAAILSELMTRHHVAGDLVPDAQLAALAIEHGLTVCSADTDFARFPEVRWENPVAT